MPRSELLNVQHDFICKIHCHSCLLEPNMPPHTGQTGLLPSTGSSLFLPPGLVTGLSVKDDGPVLPVVTVIPTCSQFALCGETAL